VRVSGTAHELLFEFLRERFMTWYEILDMDTKANPTGDGTNTWC
jgi:hypothetical protein